MANAPNHPSSGATKLSAAPTKAPPQTAAIIAETQTPGPSTSPPGLLLATPPSDHLPTYTRCATRRPAVPPHHSGTPTNTGQYATGYPSALASPPATAHRKPVPAKPICARLGTDARSAGTLLPKLATLITSPLIPQASDPQHPSNQGTAGNTIHVPTNRQSRLPCPVSQVHPPPCSGILGDVNIRVEPVKLTE